MSSESGVGTTFKVYFPVSSEEPTSVQAKAVTSRLRGSETILVVEDDLTLRALDQKILEHYGYQVLVAADAAEALRICADRTDTFTSSRPMSSCRAEADDQSATGSTSHRPETKVIYMSGYTDEAIVRHGVLDPGTSVSPEAVHPGDAGSQGSGSAHADRLISSWSPLAAGLVALVEGRSDRLGC